MLKRNLICLTFLFLYSFLRGQADETLDLELLLKLQEYQEISRNDPNQKYGVLREIITLIEEGADPDFIEQGDNFDFADVGESSFGYIMQMFFECDPNPLYDELINVLAQTGIDFTTIDNGHSVFAHKGPTCQIMRFLNNGIKPASDDGVALQKAVYVNEAERIGALLKAGINPETPIQRNVTALMIAALVNYYNATQSLLSYQKKCDQRNDEGLTALHYAVRGISLKLNPAFAREKLQTIKVLLERGIPINAQDNEGATPLIYAVKVHEDQDDQPDQKLINMVISSGADPLQKDKHGLSALHYASHKRLTKLITAILYAITLYCPEKLSAAEHEIHIPLTDIPTDKTSGMLKTYARGTYTFAIRALAAWGIYKTIMVAKAYCSKTGKRS